MFEFLLLLLGLILLFSGGIYLKKKILGADKRRQTDIHYQAREYFFTAEEKQFYHALKGVADELELVVFAKVRLADVVSAPKDNENWLTAWNKIRSKHVDFVLCENTDYKPKVVIELNGASHERNDRKERDEFVRDIFESINIDFVEIDVSDEYDGGEIISKIQNKLSEN